MLYSSMYIYLAAVCALITVAVVALKPISASDAGQHSSVGLLHLFYKTIGQECLPHI